MIEIKNFIHNEFVAAESGEILDNYEPATGKVYSILPKSGEPDIKKAVDSAKEAFKTWSQTKREERSDYLLKIGELIKIRADDFAEAESKDQGKTVELARKVDIPRAIKNFDFFANAILHEQETCNKLDGVGLNYAMRCPIGVTGLISPWNLPLYLMTWKIAPALAVGNTAVCKPSELTPMTAYMLADILKESGLPPGVCNIVFGLGAEAGRAIVKHPDVPLISFTGGTATAESISKDAAPYFKKLGLELGGKNPNIIFEDANLKEAIKTTLLSSFNNQGEICLCGSRIFVHKNVYGEFLEKFKEQTSRLVAGDPKDDKSFMGALVSEDHYKKVMGYIHKADQFGGKLLQGGGRPENIKGTEFENGYFIEPTIITAEDTHCALMQEEIFGPVVTVTPFEDEGEVIEWANGTKYGLSASVWTENVNRAHRVAEKIHAGTVWINSWMVRDLRVPFGGVKASGLGREGGSHSIDFYTELKNVFVKY